MSDYQPPPPPSGDAATDAPPPPPPPPPATRPLLRRDQDKHLAGVAGGLADYFGVDAALLRVAMVVLAFLGVGIPLYLVGWVAMPSPSMPQSYVERWFGRSPNPAALIAVAAGLIVVLAATDAPGGDGVGWGLALLFGGWLLFRADNRATSPLAGTPPTFPAAQGWHGAGGVPHSTTPAAPASHWTPPPPQPRSILGRLTIGIALASVGVAALLEQLGAVNLEPQQYTALALTITGCGLIVGAWAGRAYGLIGLGLVLLPVTFALSIGPLPLDGGAGDVTRTPASLEEVEERYRLGLGELEVDLTRVDFGGATTAVDVSVGVGQAVIVVPDDVTVSVDADMRLGEVDLFGDVTTVSPVSGPVSASDEGIADGGRLELNIDSGVGETIVRRQTQEL